MKQLRSALALGALAVATLLLPLFVARHFGALGAVRGDDWSYLRSLFHWADTGKLNFNNWVSMTLIGQLVVAAPVAKLRPNSIASVQVLTAAWGFIGIALTYVLTTRVTQRRKYGFGLALLVGTTPLWGALSVGYMTDIPAYTAVLVTLALAVRALEGDTVDTRYLQWTIVAGAYAFTIREYAIIPAVAATIIGLMRLREEANDPELPDGETTEFAAPSRRQLRGVLVTALAAFIFIASVMLWWRTIPNGKGLTPQLPDGHSIRTLFYKGAGVPRLAGLLLMPAILMAGPLRIVRRAFATQKDTAFFYTVFVTFAFAFSGASGPRIAFAGNYMSPDGALAQSVGRGHRPDLIGEELWSILVAVGSLGAVLLALAMFPTLYSVVQRVRSRNIALGDPIAVFLGLAMFGYGAVYSTAALVGLPLYDRYAMPLLPIVGISLLRRSLMSDHFEHPMRKAPLARRIRKTSAAGALALLVALGSVYMVDSASYDGSRYRVATAAERAGYAPRDIGGSFEWVNYHAAKPGTGVRKRERFCVRVMLLPKGAKPGEIRKMPNVVALGRYEPPFQNARLVAAIREPVICKHSNLPVPR